MCPGCSKKLNYYHPKNKATKKLPKVSEEFDVSKVKEEPTDSVRASTEPKVEPTVKTVEISAKEESQMWSKAPELDQEKSREQEIEEYLQDLFM